jgi:4a-hydroxytetrahydrobiopterin dehydratase
MERRKLSEEEARDKLAGLEGWRFKEDKIKKSFKFENFAAALAFVNKIGEIAERLDHHPDIKFGWGYAKVKTTTHDRDGVTEFDIELARQIDGLPGAAKAQDDPDVSVESPS